ncbi:hypothetical protein N9247_00835 [bacterium]|nr:hypothetical protein [bacterium]
MLRVLIVSPRFAPSNAADHHRVRLLLPYLRDEGCEATVLAVEPERVACPVDEWLAEGLPDDVPVVRVRAASLAWSRIPGLGRLAPRAKWALARAGDELLSRRDFDLVYFSTTEFGLHTLGPRWKAMFGVRFVMDYQDPWVTDYYANHPEVIPPGGRLKYSISRAIGKQQEARVLQGCSGITAVSESYPRDLRERYPWIDFPDLVLPFPGDDRDLQRASTEMHTLLPTGSDHTHWVYVGVVSPSMLPTVRAFLRAVARSQHDHLRIHFIGTSYAPAGTGKASVEPIARELGIEAIVQEVTDRIPYSEALATLRKADAVLALGTDDESYTASKIYSYLLAKRPMLAVFHRRSSVVDLIQAVGGSALVTFGEAGTSEEVVAQKITAVIGSPASIQAPPLNEAAFAPFTARHQAAQLVGFLERVSRG